jgi:hypothetical protein
MPLPCINHCFIPSEKALYSEDAEEILRGALLFFFCAHHSVLHDLNHTFAFL